MRNEEERVKRNIDELKEKGDLKREEIKVIMEERE